MKKLVVLLMIVLILFGSVSHAEEIELYSVLCPMKDTESAIVFVVKSEDRIIVGSVQMDLEKDGTAYSADDEGVMTIEGSDGSRKAMVYGDKLLYELLPGGTSIALNRVDPLDASLCSEGGYPFNIPDIVPDEKEPITLSSGVYIAGEDFPEGTYRIELVNDRNSGSVRLYESMEKVTKSLSYLFSYSLGSIYDVYSVGKIVIKKGNALSVRNTNIILLPYDGIK